MKFKKTHLRVEELALVFATSPKTMIRMMEKAGLMNKRGQPSHTAFFEKFVKSTNQPRAEDKYLWHGQKTVAVLIEDGAKPAVPPPTDLVVASDLNGPFQIRTNSGAPAEIVSADGEVVVWVAGERNAQIVCRLLNTGFRLGVISARPVDEQPQTELVEDLPDTEPCGFVICGVR